MPLFNRRRKTILGVVTATLISLMACFTQADILHVEDIQIPHGNISNQPLSVLHSLEQSGSSSQNNNWDAYKEISPDNKRFTGKFNFFLNAGQQRKEWSALTVKTNTLGSRKSEQRWDFHIRDFANGKWVKIGDNQNAKSWVWHYQELSPSNNASNFISNNGKVTVRYRSNNDYDVSDVDYLIVELAEATCGDCNPTPTPTVTPTPTPDALHDIPLQSRITKVQPMTGIVLWASEHNGSVLKSSDEYIQLEYAYVKPSDVVKDKNNYDWTIIENLLEQTSNRGKQAILSWYYVYHGDTQSAVPKYILQYDGYRKIIEKSEGNDTRFADWSHPELKQATLDFYTAFAARYDNDPRIAFLQVGFGLWGEYHIYDPNVRLGDNFPAKAYQKTFINHLGNTFHRLHWSISIDAGDEENTPFSNDANVRNLQFGMFDDSFMHEEHNGYNEDMWNVFDYQERFTQSPHGGELSYYSNYDQKHALDKDGMYGRTYEQLSAKFHISYMIGNDQPSYQNNARIKEAGMANGYKYRITEFKASSTQAKVTIVNEGIAPIYYDAFIAVDGHLASANLKDLLPGNSMTVLVDIDDPGSSLPVVTIESDYILDNQEIQFNADL